MIRKAIVVLSGGQDSTTCLGFALAAGYSCHCLTFDYGQRHSREIEAAVRVADFYKEKYAKMGHLGEPSVLGHEVLTLPSGILSSTSPLVDRSQELEQYENHEQMEAVIGDRVEKTFVPMRNALFLTVAANRAAALGCESVITGVCQADNANYPDCRRDFITAAEKAANEALGRSRFDYREGEPYIRFETPIIIFSKAETVRLALSVPYAYAALAFSHTAYDGAYPPTGADHATVLRAHGFEQAGRPDPLVLRAVHEGLMERPATENYRDDLFHSFTDALKGDWT